MASRQVKEKRVSQGVDEVIPYAITTTPWGGSPAGVSFKVFTADEGTFTDVTTTAAAGSATVSSDVIILPGLGWATEGAMLRTEVKWTSGGATLETFFEVTIER